MQLLEHGGVRVLEPHVEVVAVVHVPTRPIGRDVPRVVLADGDAIAADDRRAVAPDAEADDSRVLSARTRLLAGEQHAQRDSDARREPEPRRRRSWMHEQRLAPTVRGTRQ